MSSEGYGIRRILVFGRGRRIGLYAAAADRPPASRASFYRREDNADGGGTLVNCRVRHGQ